MKNTLTSLALAGTLALGLTGCGEKTAEKPSGYSYQTHPVDKLLRDHNGWRTLYSNTNNELIEVKYFDRGDVSLDTNKVREVSSKFAELNPMTKTPRIYLDLPENSRGEARVLIDEGTIVDQTYVEIHLPSITNQADILTGGTERWKVGKVKKTDLIKEIK